jgi:hypothetical protein
MQTEMVTKENLLGTLPGAAKERRRDTIEEDTARGEEPRWLTTIQVTMSVWLVFWMVRCIVSSETGTTDSPGTNGLRGKCLMEIFFRQCENLLAKPLGIGTHRPIVYRGR